MSMITYIILGSNDVSRSRIFYDIVLSTLGYNPGFLSGKHVYYVHSAGPAIGIGLPYDGQPATHGNGVTVGFSASDESAVNAFHAAGIASGGADEGLPGPRPYGPGTVYAAYIRDPDGNKICAYAE